VTHLEIKGLSKQFRDVQALDSLDLQVERGELLSMLGPSGCGKTTALRIIAGFEQADDGEVVLDGKCVNDVPASRRNMGMVFQAYSLFPTMTARENVEFGLKVRRVSSAKRSAKAKELLELVRLGARADRYPHQLSGGEQQRVALARALAFEPAMLLLDEPLSALDAKVRVHVREEIRRIQSSLGITTVYVTHDQEEAFSISDRVAVMSAGRLQQVGRPADIYHDPNNLFVAEFVGTVNRLSATVGHGGEIIVTDSLARLTVSDLTEPYGQEIIALIRPEGINVDPSSTPTEGGVNILSGRIQSRSFLGAVTRLRVATPAGDLLADVASTRVLGLAEGTPVTLDIDPAAIRVMAGA
jgi:putative spermidine/putrescine transport system ATP-binding protein